jgi:hypothetical protein
MNAAWYRKLISDEFREMLMWSGLATDYSKIKTKETDKKGKTFYSLKGDGIEVQIYSPKVIYVNGVKMHSVSETKRHIQYNYIQ